MLKRLEKAIKTAKDNQEEEFTLDGNLYCVPYANYLVEYLRYKFGLDKVSK